MLEFTVVVWVSLAAILFTVSIDALRVRQGSKSWLLVASVHAVVCLMWPLGFIAYLFGKGGKDASDS